MNVELSTILILLTYTGARLAEITGLRLDEIVDRRSGGGGTHIAIVPNDIRSLKNLQSRRNVPVLGKALITLDAYLIQRTDTSSKSVFRLYGRDGGAAAASAALMKHLRAAGITSRTKVIHSLRHTIKQALRDVRCPMDVSNAIQGHTSGQVSENYGSGHSLKVMGEWLEKAYGEVGL